MTLISDKTIDIGRKVRNFAPHQIEDNDKNVDDITYRNKYRHLFGSCI
jgi:hypothetical protein